MFSSIHGLHFHYDILHNRTIFYNMDFLSILIRLKYVCILLILTSYYSTDLNIQKFYKRNFGNLNLKLDLYKFVFILELFLYCCNY